MSRKPRILYKVQKCKPRTGNKVSQALETYEWLKGLKPDALRNEAWINAEKAKVEKKLRKFSIKIPV